MGTVHALFELDLPSSATGINGPVTINTPPHTHPHRPRTTKC